MWEYFHELTTPVPLKFKATIYGIHAVYGCLAISRSHTSPYGPFYGSFPQSRVPTGEEVTSEAEKVRLGPPPENCWDTILSSSVRVLWVPGHNNPALYLFCHSDGPLLHINIYGGWNKLLISSTWYLDIKQNTILCLKWCLLLAAECCPPI